jgi:hypothetical protein
MNAVILPDGRWATIKESWTNADGQRILTVDTKQGEEYHPEASVHHPGLLDILYHWLITL